MEIVDRKKNHFYYKFYPKLDNDKTLKKPIRAEHNYQHINNNSNK
ncbi:MAG: hypothetical protein ACI9YE_002199 [Psychroserpens sp.]|jgi:hypothetical protein